MARYTPGSVADPKVNDEFLKISQALDTPDSVVMLETIYKAPSKLRDGMIIFADGTTFNPGSGAGVYCYRASAWHFLG